MFGGQLIRFATPFTTGLFLVSVVSGVALFFHVGPGIFHSMHEWLSMVLLVPVAFHVWKNWGAIANYFKRGTLVWPVVASLVVAVGFAVPALTSGAAGGNPQMAMYRAIAEAPISDVAPILKTTPDALMARLQAAGVAASADQSMAQAAVAAGKEARGLVFQILTTK